MFIILRMRYEEEENNTLIVNVIAYILRVLFIRMFIFGIVPNCITPLVDIYDKHLNPQSQIDTYSLLYSPSNWNANILSQHIAVINLIGILLVH